MATKAISMIVIWTVLLPATVAPAGIAQGEQANRLVAVNRVRFLPAKGHEEAMLGRDHPRVQRVVSGRV